MTQPLQLTVNGVPYRRHVATGASLLQLLRDELGLTGAKEGCDDSECGACMILLDGRPLNACSFLALQADGRAVTTVEGLTSARGERLRRAFVEEGAVQCGFCTPGMLVSAAALFAEHPRPTDEQTRRALAGNLCRCTGYAGIFRAVRRAADTDHA